MRDRDATATNSCGRQSFGSEPIKTPARIGIEIQICPPSADKYQTGSIYTFVPAKDGLQFRDDWNSMDIESRIDVIRVRLNSKLVSEFAGDPARSKTGPVGLQLHDRFSFVMFRNIRIREIAK